MGKDTGHRFPDQPDRREPEERWEEEWNRIENKKGRLGNEEEQGRREDFSEGLTETPWVPPAALNKVSLLGLVFRR